MTSVRPEIFQAFMGFSYEVGMGLAMCSLQCLLLKREHPVMKTTKIHKPMLNAQADDRAKDQL